jgi:hypothetical protein
VSLTTTAVIALAGWVHAFGLRATRLRGKSLLVAFGITCGLAGDVALSERFLAEKPAFIAGMICFGLGHGAYLAAMLSFASTLPEVIRRRVLGGWAMCHLGCVYGWYQVILHAEVSLGLYAWAILGYSVLLAGTAGVGLGLALAEPTLWPLAAGGVLFVVSDFFIVLRLFNPARDAIVRTVTYLDWTWLTYSPAQLLIVYTLPWVVVVTAIKRRRVGVGEPVVVEHAEAKKSGPAG